MSVFPGPFNAVVYAQFNIQGRWRRMLSVAVAYAVLVGAGMWITGASSDSPRSLEPWVGLLCVSQAINLLLFGSFRVEAAVRGDVTSRMLESHRLMPTPPLASILGYMFGSPLQAFLLAIANFGLGIICCAHLQYSLETWALTNGILFCFALFVYAMIVQYSFVARGGFLLLLMAGVIAIVLASNQSINNLPAVPVLLSPLLSESSVIALLMGGGRARSHIELGYIVALAGQAVIALIAIRVAIRRYRSPEIAGISARLGLMMLAAWVALSAVQNYYPDSFSYYRSTFNNHSRDDSVAQVVLAFSSVMLLALLPIGSAAWTARQGQRTGDPSLSKARISLAEIFTVLAAAAIVAGMLLDVPPDLKKLVTARWWTMVIAVNFLFSMALLFSWGYLIRRRAWVFVFIWVLITWMVPIAADGIYRSWLDDRRDATPLTAFSPPGAITLAWANSDVSLLPGIVGQLALSLVPTGILLLTQSRVENRKSAIRISESSPNSE